MPETIEEYRKENAVLWDALMAIAGAFNDFDKTDKQVIAVVAKSIPQCISDAYKAHVFGKPLEIAK